MTASKIKSAAAQAALSAYRRVRRALAPRSVQFDLAGYSMRFDGRDDAWRYYWREREQIANRRHQALRTIAGHLGEGCVMVDVGANYGLTTLVEESILKPSVAFAIEPDLRVTAHLGRNLYANMSKASVVNMLCLDSGNMHAHVCLHPYSSLDNRAWHSGWRTREVPAMTINQLALDYAKQSAGLFLKVDVQGSECRVIDGALDVIERFGAVAILIEFAPAWLESQGWKALDLLERLWRIGSVYEVAETYASGWDYEAPIMPRHGTAFVEYVRRLRPQGLGQVDLVVIK